MKSEWRDKIDWTKCCNNKASAVGSSTRSNLLSWYNLNEMQTINKMKLILVYYRVFLMTSYWHFEQRKLFDVYICIYTRECFIIVLSIIADFLAAMLKKKKSVLRNKFINNGFEKTKLSLYHPYIENKSIFTLIYRHNNNAMKAASKISCELQ